MSGIHTVERVVPSELDDVAWNDLKAGLYILIEDSVAGGASVGFHHPLKRELGGAWVESVLADVRDGHICLIIARAPDGTVCGTVQMALCGKQNGPHRAEVQKLLVHSAYRRRGIGRMLMQAVEAWARNLGRRLLVLDTQTGSDGERLYAACGWTRVGEIPGFTVEADGRRAGTMIFYRDLGITA